MLSVRHHAILEIAKHQGRVTVDDLAGRFAVTPQTIRKDLNDLCDKRLLARVHGGAIISSGVENVGYEARRLIASEEKEAIGKAAAALIPNHSSLFISIGTTTEAIAKSLLQHTGLMVITNDMFVANTMRSYPNIEVIITCGIVRQSDGGIVGEPAVEFVRQFKVDYAIISASAIERDGVLLDYDIREVKVIQAAMSSARNVIFAADSTKFDRSAPVRIGELRQVGTFITDYCPNDEIRAIAEENGVSLVEALPRRAVSSLDNEAELP